MCSRQSKRLRIVGACRENFEVASEAIIQIAYYAVEMLCKDIVVNHAINLIIIGRSRPIGI